MVKHQKFLLGTDNFYMIDDMGTIVVPENSDYKSDAIHSTIYEKMNRCEISMYQYCNDLIHDNNCERVQSFKDYLISEKINQIDYVNNDFIITIDYDLYNNCGNIISSGSLSTKSKNVQALITPDIDSSNHLNYRKGLLCDSGIEIQIPRISRYGIKNKFDQHPYVIKFNSIKVSSTIGDYSHIIESDSQEMSHIHHSHHVNYEFHRHCPRLLNNHATHFLTNAKVGTTIIDQTVVPTKLEVPPVYTEVDICEIKLPENQYKIKIDNKIDIIIVNIEVFIDNILEVYDINDINEIIKINNDEPTIPDNSGDEEDNNTNEPTTPDNSGDEEDNNTNEPTTPDNSGDENNTDTNEPTTPDNSGDEEDNNTNEPTTPDNSGDENVSNNN